MKHMTTAVLALTLGFALSASAISHTPTIVNDNPGVQTDASASAASSDSTVILGASATASGNTLPLLKSGKGNRYQPATQPPTRPPTSVPDGSSALMLLSIGMLGLETLRRKLA